MIIYDLTLVLFIYLFCHFYYLIGVIIKQIYFNAM